MSLRRVDIDEFGPVIAPVNDQPFGLEMVAIADLRIDETYQRPIEKRGRANVRKIAEAFDWALFLPCLVSRRPCGTLALIDGQHRVHAAALRGVSHVPAMVVACDVRAEARAFAKVNGQVTNLTPLHIYRAALAAREPWARKAHELVEAAGCRLMTSNRSARAKKAGEVYAVTLVRRQIEAGHAAHLSAVLGGLTGSCLAEEPEFFGGRWLKVLIDGARMAGLTSAPHMAAFLDATDLDRLEVSVRQIHKTPDYAGRSLQSLMADSVAVSIKAWARKAREASA